MVGLIAAGASMYMQNQQGKAARKESKSIQKQQMAQQAGVEQRYKDSMETESQTAAASAARDRQRGQAAGATGMRSTILTSPLGLIGEPTTAKKSLLGG